MKRPIFHTIFEKKSDFCEKSSKLPVDKMIPGQAIKLSELVSRFDRGQRLNVHANFPVGSNFSSELIEENFEDAAPDNIHDLVDVEREYHELQDRKTQFAETIKKKRSQQAPPKEEAPQDPLPVDPAK